MVDNNDAVFALAKQVTFEAVTDGAAVQAGNHAREIRKFIKQYNDQLYTEMARTGVLLSGTTPSILLADGNPYGRPWKPHTQNYRDRKSSEGYDGGFYRRKGLLAQDLFSRSSTRDFGAAQVTVSTRGAGINTSKYSVDSSGRARFIRGSRDLAGRGIGGRFAPLSAFRSLVFSIEMQLFTKLDGNVTASSVKSLYPKAIGKKLGVGEFGRSSGKGGAQPSRPLLRPFLHWFSTTNFRNRFYEQFQIKV